MSQDWCQDVRDFHDKYVPEQTGDKPAIPSPELIMFRFKLMLEELQEIKLGIYKGDLPAVIDGLVDLINVTIGTGIACGVDLRPVWDAVHAANMSKGPSVNGKPTKPPGWQPPYVAAIIREQATS
jgi:predicted HAD superfamily Cof-like phosphohydrolase